MKIDPNSSENLKFEIVKRLKASELNYSEIGRIARVHSSQVSRICRGKFKTLSNNVVQVCKVLGVEVETVKLSEPAEDSLERRLERSVLEVWDRTPSDAERLERFMRQLVELRRTSHFDASR